MNINSKQFSFNYYYGGYVEVNNIYEGALKYGGATLFEGGAVSNIEIDDYIRINEENNIISIYVPSTINVDQIIDNSIYVKSVVKKIRNRYNLSNIKFYGTKGSWRTNVGEVLVENITIVTLELLEISELDIKYFINIAENLKKEMSQEGISININGALAVI